MPHKRAKRSVREKARAERKSDLPPSESTFTPNDIPKSMARVLNAETVQSAWREKKRTLDGEAAEGDKRKKRKTESGSAKPDIRIKPGESLRHFKRRVEDDMRPIIRSAMKNATSISKQKLKQSEKGVEQFTNVQAKHSRAKQDSRSDSDSEGQPPTRQKGGKNKTERSPSPDFIRISSSAPKRLNNVVKAPPELKAVPRLDRLVQRSQKRKSENKGGRIGEDEDDTDGIVTLQQKRMMELEREKAINRYRALKEAKLKGQRGGAALS